MRPSAAACSARGTERAVNQDRAVVQAVGDRALLAVIADGVGSYACSEAASKLAASLVCADLELGMRRGDVSRQALKRAVQMANAALWREAIEREQPMKTTLSALVCVGSEALLAHVGDCRIYMVRACEARVLTRDHSSARAASGWRWLASALALPLPGEHARHTLTRVLGDQPIVQVDTRRCAVQPHDRFILCSDGVWSGVPPASLAALAAEQENNAALAHKLMREAQARGSTDDASVIVVSPGAISGAETATPAPSCTFAPRGATHDVYA